MFERSYILDGLINWLIGYLIDCLIDLVIDLLTDLVTRRWDDDDRFVIDQHILVGF